MFLLKLFLLFLPLIGYTIQSTDPYCQICTVDQLIQFVETYRSTYNLNWQYLLVDTGFTIYTQDYVTIQNLQYQLYNSYGIYTYFFLFDGYVDTYTSLEAFAKGLMDGIDSYYSNNRAKTLVVFITLGSRAYYYYAGNTISTYLSQTTLDNLLYNAVKTYFPSYQYASGIYQYLSDFGNYYASAISSDNTDYGPLEPGDWKYGLIILGIIIVIALAIGLPMYFCGCCDCETSGSGSSSSGTTRRAELVEHHGGGTW